MSKKEYWKSIHDSKEQTGEFLSTPLEASNVDEGISEHTRREFLKIMGASFAMMGAACTRRPVEKIIPYLKKPEEATPGVANWYASTCGECDSSCGVLVKTREGRPIKFEGNPAHPHSQGGLCARGQASVLNLYDPDRLQSPLMPLRKGAASSTSWEEIDGKVLTSLKETRAKNGRIRILTGEMTSPSTRHLISEFLKNFGNGQHITYEPMSCEETVLAQEMTYGTKVIPHYRFENAEAIVSFGADFLGTWHNPVEFAKGFAKGRKPTVEKPMSEFIVFESLMTLTGSNADKRYKVKSGQELKAALAVASELIVGMGKSKFAHDVAVTSLLNKYRASVVASQLGFPAHVFVQTAQMLWEKRGKSLVIGGGQSVKGDHGIGLELVVNLLNSALENEGVTVDGTINPTIEESSYANLKQLISDMKKGLVDVLLIHQINPVYTLPPSLGFVDALSHVKLIIDFSTHLDETAAFSDIVATTHHYLENWADASPSSHVYSIFQPTISPLYRTRSFQDSLITWAKVLGFTGTITSHLSWYEYLKNHWNQTVYKEYGIVTPFPLFWESLLREGVFNGLNAKTLFQKPRTFKSSALAMIETEQQTTDLSMVLYPKISQYDGRTANNGWLQELPDPVTKITWDNYASISPATAKQLGVSEEEVVRLRVQNTIVELPAHIQPGLGDHTIAVAVGYGRTRAGRVGNNVGVNVYPLVSEGSRVLQYSKLQVNVEKTGKTVPLACTQKHHNLENRPIIKEATYEEWHKNPAAGNEEKEKIPTIWPKHEYPGYRWAMAIDLSSCTGCSACVIGCQSENNIPTVGKRFVLDGREMHWIRLDRYYSGKIEDPQTVHQPMLCQHCENAPCETVCPVLATLHDPEGLNQQIYNRCVGTRYCANNCPYKVRRFNWFTFSDVASPQQLVYNPDLTVRTRGVMEKCTFCVQRIIEAKDRAKDFGRQVNESELKTACQQSCPTQAITFGNINDKGSQVYKFSQDPRGYHVLEELNVKPSITYLTKIRNGQNA